MGQLCDVCGKKCGNKKKIEFIHQWGRTLPGAVLNECMVGVGVSEILVNKGIARYKKSASKKNIKAVSSGGKSKRSESPPKG